MSLLVSLLGEVFAALLALEWLRLEVRADVVESVANLCEGAVTLET